MFDFFYLVESCKLEDTKCNLKMTCTDKKCEPVQRKQLDAGACDAYGLALALQTPSKNLFD